MQKRRIIPTCSMCAYFDSNRSICKLNGDSRVAISSEHAIECQKNGDFVRYLYVLPDAYNYYSKDEEIPHDFKLDMSRLPKDEHGYPLFVSTNRGIERAIPANKDVVMKSHPAFGVESIYTYQGQRELIYELGVENARKEADRVGITLTVLPEEVEYDKKKQLESDKELKKKNYWLSGNEGW